MKCPYCNKYLKQVHTTAYCYWCGCDKTDGMFGTLAMWEKVAQLVKIRNAGKRYMEKHKEQHREYARNWYHKNKKGQQ